MKHTSIFLVGILENSNIKKVFLEVLIGVNPVSVKENVKDLNRGLNLKI